MEASYKIASIDTKAISGLTKVLRMLESCGGAMDVDQVWNGYYPTPETGANPGLMGHQALLRVTLKSSLKELGHLLDALECLTGSLQKRITSLKAVYEPLFLSHWMDTAPVEILDNIFEEVCSGKPRLASELSKTNRRFYDIVTQCPRLWNDISNFGTTFNREEIRLILERSKNVGLNAVISFECGGINSCFDFLGAITLESSRLENVVYNMELQDQVDWQELFEHIYEYSTGLDLPRLRSATLKYPQKEILDDEEHKHMVDHSEPLMHFYTSWVAPKLTELRVFNLFPQTFLRLTPPLTKLDLWIFEQGSPPRVYDMNLLLEFLRSSPLLETLYLAFEAFTPSTREDDRTLSETVLPNVQTFRFTTLYMSWRGLQPFMKALRLPLLRELYVCNNSDSGDPASEMQGWFDFIFPLPQGHYTNVEVFSYEYKDFPPYEGYCLLYRIPFLKLPNLRNLTLKTTSLNPYMGDWDTHVELPGLTEVHFVGCNVLDESTLYLFREALQNQDKWETLKEVTFTKCRSLQKEDV